ncbi:MAG: hypothetical protein H6670_10825 [Anaerolineaceae bacterium]|nr:hypothetical protein [Anaerolineaceae bacterium]
MRSGAPFIRVNRRNQLVPNVQPLSKIFHNWFYAGWVVTDWADIKPKTIRGQWEPMVSTEDFELGLKILAKRRQKPLARKRNFYLLQGLVYLESTNYKLTRLSCSRPNVKRTRGGASYYRIAGTDVRFTCADVDQQVGAHLHRIQVDSERMPAIRRIYNQDMNRYIGQRGQEAKLLTQALELAKDKELNVWRGYTQHGMHNDVYMKLAQEVQSERERIENALQLLYQENSSRIEDLDMALDILSQIGERYPQLDRETQREVLRKLVSKVILNVQGEVNRLELLPPFVYLRAIAEGGQSPLASKLSLESQPDPQTTQYSVVSCSTYVALGTHTNNNIYFLAKNH